MKKTNNNKSLKRLLSILLALSMCASMVCTTVFAEETGGKPTEPGIEADDQTNPGATPDGSGGSDTTPDNPDDSVTIPSFTDIKAEKVDDVFGDVAKEAGGVSEAIKGLEEFEKAEADADEAANSLIEEVTGAATGAIDQGKEIVDAANGVIDAAAGQASAAAGQAEQAKNTAESETTSIEEKEAAVIVANGAAADAEAAAAEAESAWQEATEAVRRAEQAVEEAQNTYNSILEKHGHAGYEAAVAEQQRKLTDAQAVLDATKGDLEDKAAAKTATAATAKAAQDAAKTAQDEYNTAKGNAADITEKTLKDAFEDNFRTDLDNKVDAAQKAADALTAEDAPNPDAAEKDWDDAIDHWKELDKEKTEAETEKNKKDFEVTRLTNQVKDAQTTVNDRIQDIADNGTATETQKNLLGEVNGSLTTERDLLKIEKGVKKGLEDSRNELTGLRDDLNASVAATNGWNNTNIVVGSMGTNKDLNFGTHKASDIQKAFDNPKGPEFNAIYQAALGLYNDPALAKNVPLRKLRRY